MAKNGNIVSFTAEELAAKRARGEDRTDWTKADALTGAEIEAAVASDPDEAGMSIDWAAATVSLPRRKSVMTIRLDEDVLDYFRQQGRGYQTKINAILRSYIEHAKS